MHLDLMRDKSKCLPNLSAHAGIESLRIWHCGYRTLKPVEALRDLRILVIASFPDDSLSMIGSLRQLRHLKVVHLPRVHDLAPLADLRQLESLLLSTLPSWDASGRLTEVESLEPLGRLPSLRHLALFGVVSKTRSLKPLERCKTLVSGRFSKYPKRELERYYQATGVSCEHVPEPETD